ncbi:hypothetical protein B0T11DRAFT_115474 [Plectosphaerella cucumerina]|uniref:F-box domain-containing protein n=1 Tax=Plectosphaerella cucumerina TaxID=40658 RepID=A0A8K0TEK8_9PEZI|nr:hypothetical protein B0T11DRAFT_115474 [Plectosphaerella cucumerina]
MATKLGLAEIINTIPPILDSLLSHLTIADLRQLHGVCKALWWLIDEAARRVDHKIGRFIKERKVFFQQLKKNRGFVYGPFVLDLLDLTRCPSGVLDVYVESGPRLSSFGRYLEDAEHYVLLRTDATGCSSYGHDPAGHPRIRLRTYDGAPCRAILGSACTTADVNFMSWNKIYSIFPSATIDHHKFYPLKIFDDNHGAHLKEMNQLGWTTRDLRRPDETTQPIRESGPRRVGDSLSFVFQLDDDTTEPGDAENASFYRSIEYSLFDVVDIEISRSRYDIGTPYNFGSSLGLQRIQTRIEINEVASPALRLRYTCGSETANRSWSLYIKSRLERWAIIEFLKMGPEGRPTQFRNAVTPLGSGIAVPDGFEVPTDWNYADDQIPIWYDLWKDLIASK